MGLIDAKGNQAGVVPFKEALQDAKDVGLDLVEISPNSSPPVVKIMNYGKFKYKQEKQKSTYKKKQKKIKVTVWFRGREMIHQQLGGNILKKVEKDLTDIGKVEFFTKMEGRQINMILTPKKVNNININ